MLVERVGVGGWATFLTILSARQQPQQQQRVHLQRVQWRVQVQLCLLQAGVTL